MLWGYFASNGPGALDKVNGILNLTQNKDILAPNMVSSERMLNPGRKCILDNAHMHT
jgi:hypothetical protein